MKPNVPLSHTWTGEKIQKLARQGDVYIRPTYECDFTDCSEVRTAMKPTLI